MSLGFVISLFNIVQPQYNIFFKEFFYFWTTDFLEYVIIALK